MRRTLAIAGSDSGGGAGIQADIKTFQELNTFGMSAVTAITAQNTLGVHGVYPIEIDGIRKQIVSVVEDIGVDAVKTGMLVDRERIELIVELAEQYKWENFVVDPVMVSTSGSKLLADDAIEALTSKLVPLSTIITPNIPEAEVMTGKDLRSEESRRKAVLELYKMGPEIVLLKGGHDDSEKEVTDIYYNGKTFHYFKVPKIATTATHGTGCTYAAAITAYMAHGFSRHDSVYRAKQFVHAAIKHGLELGSGNGPTNHSALRVFGEVKEEVEVIEVD